MAEYIEREDVKSIININFSGLLLAVDLIPAADVVPVVHGHWIKDNDSFQTDDDYYCYYFNHICSECGEIVNDRYKLPNYCPDCGAKMDGGTDDGA